MSLRGELSACVLLLAFALALVPCGAAPAASQIRLSDVKRGETVEITYSSVGCFHFEHARFVFSPQGAGEFIVTELRPASGEPSAVGAQPRGRVILKPGVRERFDRLLEHYRTPPQADEIILTGHTSLHLLHRRGRTVLREETLPNGFRHLDGEPLHFGSVLAVAPHSRTKAAALE
jgi:hypothetical protein